MLVPEPLEITASLLAGYRFRDGSTLEVDAAGGIRVTDATGATLYDSCDGNGSDDMRMSFGAEPGDYGEIMDSAAAFLGHDAEYFGHLGSGETDELIFPEAVARWAGAHEDELATRTTCSEGQ